MPIKGMLDAGAFNPDQIAEMVAAFESTLADLRLVGRTDPVTELVTKTIECAKTGPIERLRLHDCAMAAITKHLRVRISSRHST